MRASSQVIRFSLIDPALEAGALGAAMLDRTQAEELIRHAHVDLFTSSLHRAIFSAMRSLGSDSLDYTLLISEMMRLGHSISWSVIAHLDDGVVTEIPMARRIERLRELYQLRRLGRLGEHVAEYVYTPGACSSEITTRIRAVLDQITNHCRP